MTSELQDAEIWAIESLGRFLLEHERYQRAASVFESLSSLRPDRPYAWYGLAVLHDRGGDAETALRCYARAAAATHQPIYALRHVEALLRHGRIESALPYIDVLTAASDPDIAQRATALRKMHER
jgi:tetratricopeptide (TPR) repeat protein